MTCFSLRCLAVASLLTFLASSPLAEATPSDEFGGGQPRRSSERLRADSSRSTYAISRREIFRAVQAELSRRKILNRTDLHPEDLIVQAALPVLLLGESLEIKTVRYDPYRRAVILELWAPQLPQIPPTEITVKDKPEFIAAIASKAEELSFTAGAVVEIPHTDRLVAHRLVFLTKPGTPATLVILGQNLRITVSVLPLQSGSRGQSILVRDVENGRVMRGKVMDQNLLQSSL